MKALNFQIPEGYEIDIEKSKFQNGVIQFKFINEKTSELPVDFDSFSKSLKDNVKCKLTEKYSDKLIVLDTLLNLRDLYNGEYLLCQTYCILYSEEEIKSSKCSGSSSFIFKFNNKEKIESFISNFKEQLEYIKEFL